MPADIPLHPANGIFTVERFFGIQEPRKGSGSEPKAQSASEGAVAACGYQIACKIAGVNKYISTTD